MKKLFILMVIATISTGAFAQFGVQAGATFASLKENPRSTTYTYKSKVGLTVGVLLDVPVSSNFIFQPGLNYTQKGWKITDNSSGVTTNYSLTFNYLELPLNFIYKATGGFYVGAGPALAYALSGKSKYSASDNTSGERAFIFGSDKAKDDYKAFEFSGNILAGYQLSNGIFFSVNYNLGFSDLSLDNISSLKNNYFGIRVGKKFGNGMMKKK